MKHLRFLSWFMILTLLVGIFTVPAMADGTADTYAMTITLVVPKKTPAATDFTYSAPSDLTYSGSNKTATVAAASGVTGMGTVTVKYYSDAARTSAVTETKNVGTYYVGITVAEGDQYTASTGVLYSDGWKFTVTASTPDAPAAPTKASATKSSIKLNAVSGCEYSKDGTNWQSGTEFTGLAPGTEYTFYQRKKATSNTNPSAASSAKFSTEADTYAMTITLVIKPAQTITADDVTATYGDTDKSVSATASGAISYAVKDGSGDYISVASDGKLTIKKVPPTDGKAYVIVTAAETDDYAEATKEVTVTISQAEVTVTAKNQSIYVGGTVPDLSAPVLDTHYAVTGLVGEDALTTAPTLTYQKDGSAATPDNTTAGTYDIVASGAAASDNYTITYANGTLTISDKGPQTITADDVTVTYGDTDKSVSASVTDPTEGGGAISYAVKDGSGDYIDVDITTGALTIKAVPPTDGKAYVTVTAAETALYAQATKEVTVTIGKAKAVAATVSANNQNYDGTDIPLATVTGEAAGGEMQYAIGENATTEPTSGWGTDIPSEKEAGTYYVWFKAVGDANHDDSDSGVVTTVIKGQISVTVTFKVVNGSWDEGEGEAATADKTVTLTGYEGDTLKLAATDIPAVGSKPNETYQAGSWDVTPSTETAITEATTYTYTYAQKGTISATVTFKVVNGSWDEGEGEAVTADKTVTLTGYEGDTLKLTAEQIPAVGSKPNETYQAGSWDVTPSTETAITKATTYTYTYAAKDAAVVTKAPAAKELTANGQPQELVTEGTASDGTMQYAIGSDATTPPASGWGTSIPKGTAAGTYYVWYKAVGDADHTDSVPVCVTVTIQKEEKKTISATVTFKVVHGAWGDGTTADKTVTLTGYEGDELRPQIGEIPDVTKPDAGYEAETGKWSPKEPPFYMEGEGYGDPITQDTTFTFTYGVKATYAMVASENAEHTIGDGKNAVFTFKRNIDDAKTYGKFKTALMDGKAMPAGSHTTKEGSLILTLNNTYLDMLSVGKHTVKVQFEDGEAEATVTIKEAPPVPKTGDNGNPALWIGLMVLGLIGIGGMAVTRRKSRR